VFQNSTWTPTVGGIADTVFGNIEWFIATRTLVDGFQNTVQSVGIDFAKAFINAAMSFSVPYGVIGPYCSSGNMQILTHDFVHRTHMYIFDVYYPTVLSDWWMDDWMTRVYGRLRTLRLRSVHIDHTIGHGTRYEVDFAHGGMLAKEVYAGRVRIAAWMKQHGASAAEIKALVEDSTIYPVTTI